MDIIQVASSSISAIGYDQANKTLRVIFRNGGRYDYHGVPEELAKRFLESSSKGRFYVHHIKGRFIPVHI